MSDAKRGPTVTINAHDGTPEDVAAIRAALELGLAWQAAEAALPKGWCLEVVQYPPDTWPWRATAWNLDGGVSNGVADAFGPAPADALRALAVELAK